MNPQPLLDETLRQEPGELDPAAVTPRWKRVLDIVLCLAAMPLVLPLMILIAVIIRVVSKGPILFKQERIGVGGRPFMCLKFRTMHVGNNVATHKDHLQDLMTSNRPMTKMDDQGDPRIIRFGGPLRSSGLDELPQIFNVLHGDMSLVGPRPCLGYEFERYQPWQKERFNTLPGLTGLWQVSGKNRLSFEQMIRLDVHYARNKTLWMDARIIFMTIPALIVQMQDVRRSRKAAARTAEKAPAPTPASAPHTHTADSQPAFTALSRRIGEAKLRSNTTT